MENAMEKHLSSNEQIERIPVEKIFDALLNSEAFKGFKDFSKGKNPDGDYRDPSVENASLSLSLKGWCDHRTEKGGGLFELAKDKGLLERDKEGNWRLKKDLTPSPLKIIDVAKSKTATNKQGPDPQQIWNSSRSCSYFTGALRNYIRVDRKIPNIPKSWMSFLRINETGIIIPMLNVDQTLKALKGEDFEVEKINTIYIQPEFKGKKRQLGSTESPSMTIFPPPVPENSEKASRKLVVFEGFEDALSIANSDKLNDCYFGVAHGKNNLSSISHFTANLKIQEVFIFADNDKDQGGLQAAKEEQKRLHKMKIECLVIHPKEVGLDANKALQNGRLLEFIDECEVLEFEEFILTRNEEENCENFSERKADSKPSRSFQYIDEIYNQELDAQIYLINDLIEQETLISLYGAPSAGKSLMALRMAVSVATGREFFGMKVESPQLVLYFCSEGRSGFMRRYSVLKEELKIGSSELMISKRETFLTDQKDVDLLIKEIEDLSQDKKPALIIFDTLQRNFGSEDENSTVGMSKFVHGCSLLQERFRSTIMVVHHSAKDVTKGARGSSVLNGSVDAEFFMELVKKDKEIITKFTSTKTKDSPPTGDKYFKIEQRNVVKNGKLLAKRDGSPLNSVVLVETTLPESPKSSPAGNHKKSKGRPADKLKKAEQEFKSLQDECGDEDVHLDVFRSRLKKNHPEDFDTSEKWRDLKKGVKFNEVFEFSEEDNWIRLKDSSSEE